MYKEPLTNALKSRKYNNNFYSYRQQLIVLFGCLSTIFDKVIISGVFLSSNTSRSVL